MALIRCSECGKEVSDKAHSCPHCGNPDLAQAVAKTTAAPAENPAETACAPVGQIGHLAAPRQTSANATPAIRGALIAFGVFVCLFGLRDCSTLGGTMAAVKDIQDSGQDVPAGLTVYMNYLKLMIILDFTMIYLFFRKRRSFPSVFYFYCAALAGLLAIDAGTGLTLEGLSSEQLGAAQYRVMINIVSSAVLVVPWLIYVYRSKRVRRTFVQ